MSPDYIRILDHVLGIGFSVEFTSEGREITDYAVVLLREKGETTETIRVYDGAHGHNEMHRYTLSGGSSRGRRFTAVPLEKECALQSKRSSVVTAR